MRLMINVEDAIDKICSPSFIFLLSIALGGFEGLMHALSTMRGRISFSCTINLIYFHMN